MAVGISILVRFVLLLGISSAQNTKQKDFKKYDNYQYSNVDATWSAEIMDEMSCALCAVDTGAEGFHMKWTDITKAEGNCQLVSNVSQSSLIPSTEHASFSIQRHPVCNVKSADDSRCYQLHIVKKTWQEAVDYCKNLPYIGSHLLEIQDSKEHQLIKDFLTNLDPSSCTHSGGKKYFWTGAYRPTGGGTHEFKWSSSGQDMTYADWHGFDPNNINGKENCVVMIDGHFKYWDVSCSWKTCFMCEI